MSAAIEKMRLVLDAIDQEPDQYVRINLKNEAHYLAVIAQAEAAERQAAALERANELAEAAADPFGVLEKKDAEIARLKAELAKVQPARGEDELGPYTRR